MGGRDGGLKTGTKAVKGSVPQRVQLGGTEWGGRGRSHWFPHRKGEKRVESFPGARGGEGGGKESLASG